MASCKKNKAENDKIDNIIEKSEGMKAAKKSSTKAELTVSAAAGTVKKGAEQPAEAKRAPAKKSSTKVETKPEPATAPKAEAKPAPAKKATPAKAEAAPEPKKATAKAEAKPAPAKKAVPAKTEAEPEVAPEPMKAAAKVAAPKSEAKSAPKAEAKPVSAKKAAPVKAEAEPEVAPEPMKAPAKAPAPKAETKPAAVKKPAQKAEGTHIDENLKEFSVKADEDKSRTAAKKPSQKKSKQTDAEDAIPQASASKPSQGEPKISSPSNVKTPATEEIGHIDAAEGALAAYAEETPVEEQPALEEIKESLPRGKAVEAKVEVVPYQGEVRYSDEDLAEFAEVITQQRTDALDELRMLKDRLDDLTSAEMAEESMIYSMHMAEQGSEAIEKEKTYAQIQRINEYIKKLDDALKRIKDKTYGICRVCNILIAKERLMAVPITTLSASYKIHSRCPEDGVDRIEPIKVG